MMGGSARLANAAEASRFVRRRHPGGLSPDGLDGVAATGRGLLLDAQRGIAFAVDRTQAKEFALAHWLVNGADGGRIFVRCFGGDGTVRENAAGDVLPSLTTMVWNAPSKSWTGGATMADASLNRRMTVRLGDAVAFAQIGIVGLDGQTELEALRLYGLPEGGAGAADRHAHPAGRLALVRGQDHARPAVPGRPRRGVPPLSRRSGPSRPGRDPGSFAGSRRRGLGGRSSGRPLRLCVARPFALSRATSHAHSAVHSLLVSGGCNHKMTAAATALVSSQREAERRFGLSHTALQKAQRAGRIAPEPGGGWDLETVRAAPRAATRHAGRRRRSRRRRTRWRHLSCSRRRWLLARASTTGTPLTRCSSRRSGGCVSTSAGASSWTSAAPWCWCAASPRRTATPYSPGRLAPLARTAEPRLTSSTKIGMARRRRGAAPGRKTTRGGTPPA